MRRKTFEKFPIHTNNRINKKKKYEVQQLFHFTEESCEFNDPYCELNLFLSQKIKQEIHHCSNSKKWSAQLRDELLRKITPAFQKHFPHYRLGVSALKKTWEKVQYFTHQFQEEKQALTHEGKINLPFFIRENLKTVSKLKNTCHLPPYQYAHQLAVKMSECIAVMEGIRPKIDQLTRTIWSIQRHLIPDLSPQLGKSPYDESEKTDKLIVKCILDLCAEKPFISQVELAKKIKERFLKLKQSSEQLFQNTKQNILQIIEGKSIEENVHPVLIDWIQKEMIDNFLDYPSLTFKELGMETAQFFRKSYVVLETYSKEQLESKIHNWTMQGDMFMRWIRLDHSSLLLIHILELIAQSKSTCFSHLFVKNASDTFLQKYPHLAVFSKYLHGRIWIYLKYLWYTRFFPEKHSTFDHFLLWYGRFFSTEEIQQKKILEKLEQLCIKKIPLIPFDPLHTWRLLTSEKEKKTQADKGNAEKLSHCQ